MAGIAPAGDLAEEDAGEHWAGQVQPGARREAQVVDHPFSAQVDGHLHDGTSLSGCLLAGGHGHVGGAEIGLLRAEGGDARAAAHRGVAHCHGRMLLVVFGERQIEERRVEGGSRSGERPRRAAGGGGGGGGWRW